MRNSASIFKSVLAIVLLIAAVTGFIIYVFFVPNNSVRTAFQSNTFNDTPDVDDVDAQVTEEYVRHFVEASEVSEIVNREENIAVPELQTPETVCNDLECFQSLFAECTPGTTLNTGVARGEALFKIAGPTQDGCIVSLEFTSHPTIEWVGKQMLCAFDNTKPFTTVLSPGVEDPKVCRGELFILMND